MKAGRMSRSVCMRLAAVLLASMLGAAGCGGGGEPAPAPAAEEPAAAEASLKLYVFECGRLRFDTVERFSIADDETDVRELIVPCYVVDHPDGTLLWDGGLPSTVAETEGWSDSGQRLDRTFAEQLAEYGLDVDLGSFDYVAFSHIHFDHVGVAGELTGGTWLVQQGDLDAAFPEGTGAEAAQSLLDNMRNLERMVLDGDHDVFGDGRVQIVSAPGHTPGHQVLFLDLAETGPLVLSGDLYHFRLSREERRVPTFNFDAEMSLESMEKVETFVAERNATFWIEHDLALFETLQTAPAFYE